MSWRVAVVGMMVMAACFGCDAEGADEADAILALTGDATAGEALYQTHCSACHGADARSGSAQKDLPDEDAHELVHVMLEGEGFAMPSFRETLTDQEIADIAAYLATL